jgi:ATP phosphoribosyltransferase
MITLAIPTGSLLVDCLGLLRRSGVLDLEEEDIGRRLLVERDGLRVILVKPADVAAYVGHGSADLGVAGKDQLWESPGGHYELVDLGFGRCRLVVAAPEGSPLLCSGCWPAWVRLATKYPRATAAYLARKGLAAEVIQLHGSVELAPQVGLVDAIVDLTATGRTLRENRLQVVTEIATSTARLIANQASLKTRAPAVQALIARIREASR